MSRKAAQHAARRHAVAMVGAGRVPSRGVGARRDTTEHALDGVARAVSACVAGMRGAARRVVGNDDERPAAGCLFAQGACIMAVVSQEHAARRGHAQQVGCDGDVGDVAGAGQEGARPRCSVGYGVGRCRAAAARAADCLGRSPPFPPAEARGACTAELSIITTRAGRASASAWKMRIHSPRPLPRLQIVVGVRRIAAQSFQRQPERSTCTVPLMPRGSPTRRAPGCFRGRSSAIAAQAASSSPCSVAIVPAQAVTVSLKQKPATGSQT